MSLPNEGASHPGKTGRKERQLSQADLVWGVLFTISMTQFSYLEKGASFWIIDLATF